MFADIPDDKTRQTLLEWFLKKGFVSGSEYAASLDKNITLYGVEEKQLYFDDLDAFQKTFENREKINVILDKFSRFLETHAQDIFPKEYNIFRKLYSDSGLQEQIGFLVNSAAA